MASVVGTNLPDILSGTISGDIITGLGADDIIYGFDGADQLFGGNGDDTLNGGSGDDRLDGGVGEDFFYGGSGTDTVIYQSSTIGLTIDLANSTFSTGSAKNDFYFSIERFLLTSHNDIFRGSSSNDHVSGGNGADQLFGNAGDDTLIGGTGNDTLFGGTGADRLVGGANFDTVSYATSTTGITLNVTSQAGRTGDAIGDIFLQIEALEMSSLGDAVTLGGGITFIDTGAGNDAVVGTNANETMIGGSGQDALFGGGGADFLDAGDALISGSGFDGDLLFGGSGNDTLLGGSGFSLLVGGTGNDSLLGEEGDDRLVGGAGADTLDGGDGYDTVTYETVARVDLSNQANHSGEALGDVITNIEEINLGANGSWFIGGTQNITVIGGTSSGNAVRAFAGTGAEQFSTLSLVNYSRMTSGVTFGTNSVQFVGGIGSAAAGDTLTNVDQIILTNFADTVVMTQFSETFDLSTGNGADRVSLDEANGTLNTGNQNDTVNGNFFDVVVDLGAGNDSVDLTAAFAITGPTGLINLTGGLGDDTMTVHSAGNFTISGNDGHDIISVDGDSGSMDGGVGNDRLTFTSGFFVNGSTTLTGGDGNDTISGSGGTITISGGNGDDVIGLEVITFGSGVQGDGGNDTITATSFFGSFDGGEGDDVLNITSASVDAGGLQIIGGAGNDTITHTNTTPNSVFGSRIVTIDAGTGNDEIKGMISDALTQEAFIFRTDWGNDILSGLDLGLDRINFSGIAALDDPTDLTITGNTTQTIITFGTNTLTIEGINVAEFDTSVFLFS